MTGVGELSKESKRRLANARVITEAAAGDAAGLMAALEKGGSLASKNAEGLSALAISCRLGYASCARLLIDRGADVDSRDMRGATPAMWAVRDGKYDECNAKLDCLAMLIDAGCELEARDESGATAAIWAAVGAHADGLAALLAAGCDVEARDRDGWTPLLVAAREGRIDSLEKLMGAGADKSAVGLSGMTAAMAAAFGGDLACLRLLDEGDCDWSAVDESGMTALQWARAKGHNDAAMFIESCQSRKALEAAVAMPSEKAPIFRI